ncbi:ABC transporter ATP-binding protein [Vagococcus salmoninarum]|uniref:ABC transporter ATP-binding protein n=1 Tax=Vagococcus salmoninarum TaxID=2739 RepID=UPI00187F1543|nr:ATP-binding cassette domain-containing protein [Vagococcus salmoninarum]MBE9388428.1 ATP-binding cassette domain-containing protein [Vagococcus salmoninarum]
MKIQVKEVTKVYKGQTVLENVSITVEEGQCVGLIGHNGSGKSLLLKVICGFIKADEGSVTVGKQTIIHGTNYIKEAGVIIEQADFIPYLSGLENLQLLANIQKKIPLTEVEYYLEKVGLGQTGKKKYKHYSLGMKQRLRIAQSIMEDPQVLILDEPFNGLDKEGVADILKLLIEAKSAGKTMIVTSHDQGHIDHLADKIYELESGVVL